MKLKWAINFNCLGLTWNTKKYRFDEIQDLLDFMKLWSNSSRLVSSLNKIFQNFRNFVLYTLHCTTFMLNSKYNAHWRSTYVAIFKMFQILFYSKSPKRYRFFFSQLTDHLTREKLQRVKWSTFNLHKLRIRFKMAQFLSSKFYYSFNTDCV